MKEVFNDVSRGISGLTRKEMHKVSEMIFHKENTIKLVGKRQARNGVRVRRKRIQRT
jgi:hypothetical protein